MASIIHPANPTEPRPGRFGVYGGRHVPETLIAALDELESANTRSRKPTRRSRPSPLRCSTTTPDGPRRSTSRSGSPNNWAAQKSI